MMGQSLCDALVLIAVLFLAQQRNGNAACLQPAHAIVRGATCAFGGNGPWPPAPRPGRAGRTQPILLGMAAWPSTPRTAADGCCSRRCDHLELALRTGRVESS